MRLPGLGYPDRFIPELPWPVGGCKKFREQNIRESDNFVRAPEARVEIHDLPFAPALDDFLCFLEPGHVRFPEEVDRLLRVADNEEAVGGRSWFTDESKNDRKLRRVGVLELIHEDRPEPAREVGRYKARVSLQK